MATKNKKLNSFFLNAILVIASILICLIATEIILNFTKLKYIKRQLVGHGLPYPQYHFIYDKENGYDIQKDFYGTHRFADSSYTIETNSYGCFDYKREVPEDYGLIVGDSFTWGYTSLDKKWTTILEEKSNIFMIKCGVSGYGTKQELNKAKKVIKEIGHAPRYIIALYVYNDFFNDFVFPHRTVIEGYLVGRTKDIDFTNGKVVFYTQQELNTKLEDALKSSKQSYFRKLRYKSILYNLYTLKVKPSFEKLLEDRKNNLNNKKPVKGGYLINNLDNYNIEWYNKAVEDHKQNIKDITNYSKSIGAKLLFVDMSGYLDHKRFKDITTLDNMYYYNLTKDYPLDEQSTWRLDSHWDIKGNKEVGEYIYRHYKQLGLFN